MRKTRRTCWTVRRIIKPYGRRFSGGEGGILTYPLSASYYVFSNMHETRMNIGDFYGLAYFNYLSHFIRLGQISSLNRHQRHQTLQAVANR